MYYWNPSVGGPFFHLKFCERVRTPHTHNFRCVGILTQVSFSQKCKVMFSRDQRGEGNSSTQDTDLPNETVKRFNNNGYRKLGIWL